MWQSGGNQNFVSDDVDDSAFTCSRVVSPPPTRRRRRQAPGTSGFPGTSRSPASPSEQRAAKRSWDMHGPWPCLRLQIQSNRLRIGDRGWPGLPGEGRVNWGGAKPGSSGGAPPVPELHNIEARPGPGEHKHHPSRHACCLSLTHPRPGLRVRVSHALRPTQPAQMVPVP